MVARFTRLLLALQLVCVLGIAAALIIRFHAAIWLALSLSSLLVLLLRLGITANSFRLAWRYRSQTPLDSRIGFANAVILFAREYVASMLSSSWTMPFHAFHKRPAVKPAGLPALLIHGYGCNSGYWHAMSRALQKAQLTHHAISLEPILGDIDVYVPLIAQAVEQLIDDSGHQQIVLVAHSMGGLACRAYLRTHGGSRIAKIITLGTPHHGTGLARHGVGINARQMRPADAADKPTWLAQLAHDEAGRTEIRIDRLFVSIYSQHDNIVSPQLSAHLPGAKNIALVGIGHVTLASDVSVQRHVIDEIFAASHTAH